MKYKLVRDANALTTPCEDYDFANPTIPAQELAQDLMEAMNEFGGVGLAANQIGLNQRVFCMKGDPVNYVCFNPRVVMPSTEQIVLEEGCLSFPNLNVKISRPRHVRVRFQTPSGQTVTEQLTGLSARIFQHELDHLDGMLYYNRSSRLERERAIKKSKKVNKNGKQTRFDKDAWIVDGAQSIWSEHFERENFTPGG